MKGIDHRRARRDPVYFTEHLLQIKLHNYQKHVLKACESIVTTVVWAAGRGAGKSLVMAVLALWSCFTKRRHITAYISATQRQGKLFRDQLEGMIAGTSLASSVEDSSTERITFTNGSRLYIYPGGSPISIRGLHNMLQREYENPSGIDLILDEAAQIPFETYSASVGVLTSAPPDMARKWCVGSPRGSGHWFYAEFVAGLDPAEKHTISFQTDAETCPHINKTVLEDMRKKLPPVEYRAEVKAEFMSELDSYFGGYIEPAIREYSIPLEPQSGCQYSLGIDLSSSTRLGSDWTVLAVACRYWGKDFTPADLITTRLAGSDPFIRICDVRRFQYISQASLKEELRDLVEKYPSLYSGVVESYESSQLEEFCTVIENGEIRAHGTGEVDLALNRVTPTNAMQREGFGHMHRLLRNQELELPANGDNAELLLREFKGFTYRLTDSGNITFGAASGGKDDIVYALCWALWGLRHRDIRRSRNKKEFPIVTSVGVGHDDTGHLRDYRDVYDF